MNIGLDMMGGDFAPTEAVQGVHSFVAANPDVSLYLFFDGARPIEGLPEAENIHLVPCEGVIGMDEHPARALKEKQKATISVGYHYLATGKIDAFASAGNTGAMLVGAAYVIKPMEGVTRPAVCTIVPRPDGTTGLLADAGLNADCKPENINQFALLASAYAEHVWNIPNPRVGLLNIGEEEGKGNILAQSTFPVLKENDKINFVGNIEGRDILTTSKADVMVCDGYTGNIVLKLAESIYDIFKFDRKIEDDYLERFNFEQYGGSPVLGVNKPVIIGHGVSKAKAFEGMLTVSKRMVESDFCEKVKLRF